MPWRTSRRINSRDDGVLKLDLLDPGEAPLDNLHPDLVYICAALTSQKSCEDEPQKAEMINVRSPILLAHKAVEGGAFVVFLSSNVVYSGEDPMVAASADKNPFSLYGEQKARVEDALRDESIASGVVRFGKVITPDMQLLDQWLSALRQGQKIQAFHDMYMAPIALPMACEFLFQVGESRQPGIYQLTASRDLSYYQAARYLAEKAGLDASLVESTSSESLGIRPQKNTTLKGKWIEGIRTTAPEPEEALDYFLEMR